MDGNLAKTLKLDVGDPGVVNNLVLESYKLKSLSLSNSDVLKASKTVAPTNQYFDSMVGDITLSYTATDQNSPTFQFNEWKKFTDSSVKQLLKY